MLNVSGFLFWIFPREGTFVHGCILDKVGSIKVIAYRPHTFCVVSSLTTTDGAG